MKKQLAILFFALISGIAMHAQSVHYMVNFGIQQPTSSLASEIYKPGFSGGIRIGYGDYVRIFVPIGYEQWKMKDNARSSNAMLDSMIGSRGDDPTINVYTGLGLEAAWPKDYFVTLSAATEGNIGMYVGKSHFLMVHQRDAEGVMEAHISLAYSFSGRLNFRIVHNDESDASMYLFLKYEYRVLPGALQKNTFDCFHFGFATSIFSQE